MTHPEELLAGYVDGTLPPSERAAVDAHLSACPVCPEEIELARSARAAMARLEDRPVPFGVTGAVLAEAGRMHERRGATWQRFQWAAGLAAAAAVVVVVAVTVAGPNDRPAFDASGGGTGAAGSEALAAPDVGLERQTGVNYAGDAGVRALADEAVDAYRRSSSPEAAATTAPAERDQGVEASTAGGGDATAALARPGPALRCLRSAEVPIGDPTNVLVRLLEARYAGEHAYLAVFLESSGAGQPPNRVVVWTLAVDGCQILNIFDLPF